MLLYCLYYPCGISKGINGRIRIYSSDKRLAMWDILNTKLYTIMSDPLYKSDSDSELKEAYKKFVERLILYLDTETDNIKRVRLLNMTQVEFETIKSLELSYGAKQDMLKIVYSDKVLSLTNKELDLIYRQMEYPKYFWQNSCRYTSCSNRFYHG